jgi:hypothetical protein
MRRCGIENQVAAVTVAVVVVAVELAEMGSKVVV